jgi:cytochrome c oxidase cbb3-type subunit 3
VLATAGLCFAAVAYHEHRNAVQATLMRVWPAELERNPSLLQVAVSLARPVYMEHCAVCHGADLAGNRAKGAPGLKTAARLYGNGGIGDLENTILYGVRSGHPRSHSVTDMPAEGRTRQLSAGQVGDLVEFLLSLNRRTHDESAAQRGRDLFYARGNCFDCHGSDARGNQDYGAPSLLGPWIYGEDRQTLYESIYSGRHGLCPAWVKVLTPAQIRALAAYLYVQSHS